jgi:hypothetical protein
MADKKVAPKTLENVRVLGEMTKVRVIRVDEDDHRNWLQEAPVCPQLSKHQIIHAGIMKAYCPDRTNRDIHVGVY